MCLTARNYPSKLQALAHHILQPNLPLLTSRFVHSQLNNADPDIATPYHDIFESPVAVFHSAMSTFYAPSDLSGLGGIHSEYIQSTPSWRNGSARRDTVFLERDPDVPGMKGLHVG